MNENQWKKMSLVINVKYVKTINKNNKTQINCLKLVLFPKFNNLKINMNENN